jgi:hypothetical protein
MGNSNSYKELPPRVIKTLTHQVQPWVKLHIYDNGYLKLCFDEHFYCDGYDFYELSQDLHCSIWYGERLSHYDIILLEMKKLYEKYSRIKRSESINLVSERR